MSRQAPSRAPRFRSRLQVRLFWLLLAAFGLVILLLGGGLLVAGRAALEQAQGPPYVATFVQAGPWSDRLASFYEQNGGWEGVAEMIAGYPCGEGWAPWAPPDWALDYTLAAADGTILADSEPSRVGQELGRGARAVAVPIRLGEEQVGLLRLSPLVDLEIGYPWRVFLTGALVVVVASLVVSLVLSRSISQPVATVTAATRAVAAGRLAVRVPGGYPGELGELAAAFNTMSAELARSDELRRGMTADVAHELRTPLSVIRGKLEGVQDGVYPATAEHIEPVLEQVRLLTRLVDDLHLLALAEAGQLQLERRRLDVGGLLRDALVSFGPQADDRQVILALDLPAELLWVEADGRRIAQVLGNLLTNALRHTPQGGKVTLGAVADGAGVMVTVADTGTGMAPQDLPAVFERFWRGERSRSRAGGGSGLGLAIARQIVELHGGAIGVESTLGQGARFWFTLPAA